MSTKIFIAFSLFLSAIDWEVFTVGDDTYLAISNAQNGGGPDRHRSVIYRWQGVEKFVPKHYLETYSSADLETFTADGQQYLVYANPKESVSQVYHIKTV